MTNAHSPDSQPAPLALQHDPLFDGPGEMCAMCRELDWSATPLGPSEAWPPALRTAVRLMLATPIATALWCGPSYTLVYNDTYRRILGVKHPEALGRSGAEVWNELWPSIRSQFEQVRTGGPGVYEDESLLRMERREGGAAEDAWFTYSLCPLLEEDGRCVAVHNLAVEITEKIRARDQVLEERARLFEAFRRAPSFITVFGGPDHVVQYANEAYLDFVGRRDVVGRTMSEVMPDAPGLGFGEQLDRVHRTGEPVEGREARVSLVRTPGEPAEDRYIDFVFQPLTDSDGTRWGVLGYGADVTDHVLARAEIERLLGEAVEAGETLDQASDFIGIADLDGRARYVNAAGRELVGLADLDAVRQTRVIEYFPAELQERVRGEAIPAALREGKWRGEVLFRHFATGETIPMEWNVFAVRSGRDGAIQALACIARDLRQERALSEERERLLCEAEAARAEAEAANRAKSEFLATMSHELRTPLNAIGGYAELLEMGLRGPVTEGQREDLYRIQQSQRHLLGLINEVLNYARLETGTIRYDLEPVPVEEALSEAQLLVVPQARSRGLALTVGADGPDRAVRADREKLRQILVNLAGNAVKFTPAGGRIELSCHVEGERVHFRVSDTGIGIPREKIEVIFDPFIQVRSDLARPHEGTGLGLAISRDLARGMGGDLTAESELGRGSTFTLILPVA